MEELLYMLLRGLIIGVVVSAPMGPVGIFCIQRTLDKGRWSGFYTGVGAAISDLIYCLLTGFCLSFIEEFISRHRSPIQLLGSLVLVFFGIWLIRKKPEEKNEAIVMDTDHGSSSCEGDILKGFALTFSNPLILFLIIGLFAQFNFVIEGIKFYHYMLGFLGIIAGALGWWWLVTYFVDKLRGHFNQRTMKLINVAVGIIILIFAAVGIVSSTATLLTASDKVPVRKSVTNSVSFRVADTSMKGWDVEFRSEGGKMISMAVRPESKTDPFGDSKTDVLSVKITEQPSGKLLGETTVSEGIDPYRGKNSWRVARIGDEWNVFAGNREYRHILSFNSSFHLESEPEIFPVSPGGISVSEYDAQIDDLELESIPEGEMLSILKTVENSRSLAGIYSMLDYEQDDSYAVIGGSYKVAVLPSENDGFFDIFYIDGAKANSASWVCGMKKGKLKPTSFVNIYDVEWRDAEGAWMLHDVQAEYDPMLLTLTLKFPYQSCSMRFRSVAYKH